MRPALIAAALIAAFAAPAYAQQPGVAVPGAAQAVGPQDVRVNQLIIYGDDACPQSPNPNEVTVCARLPEGDRYRLPPNLRDNPNDPANQSWANRAIELSYVGRTGTDSCSTVGGGGFTGCFNQIVTQARAQRRNSDQVNWARMIEEARQERLSHIDEQARAAEEAARQEEEAARPH
jgi:hypothetical protein